MIRKRYHFLSLLCVAALCFMDCSQVDEADRLIPLEATIPTTETIDGETGKVMSFPRSVLIEDFTGQRCINCPSAAAQIESLQKLYDHRVVAVGIHSGNLAVFPTSTVVGLRTALGDEYYSHWHIEAEPSGYINRTGEICTPDKWPALVYKALQQASLVKLTVNATAYTPETRALSIELAAQSVAVVSGNLQVWLTESGITALQMMPDGRPNPSYVHNHVLREAVNGEWGQPVTLSADETKTITLSTTVAPQWKPENVSVVAFLYNDEQGVLQVTEKKIDL